MSRAVIEPAPVRRNFLVRASVEKAFEVFTAGFGRWWPASHQIGSSPLKTAVVEPGVGGRWYEIDTDGAQVDWGRVLTWEPPTRLVLAWQINADFHFDADLVTEIEVRFTPEGAGATRVDFEHRNLERLGERAAALRESLNGGWGAILDLYAKAAA
jgi:uncharacterized protein YndB with AHSA1/START domain